MTETFFPHFYRLHSTRRALIRSARRLLNEVRLCRRSDTLAIEIHANNGFFAQLNWCLYILAYCEEHHLTPEISLTGAQYKETPGQDWLHDFFDKADRISSRKSSNDERCVSLSIEHINETRFADEFGPSMTIERAHRLFTTYYQVKKATQSYINDFVSREFSAGGVVGLHFRGTDKSTEAPPVDWPCCFRAVVKFVADRPEVKAVFISSDDSKFIQWFSAEARGTLSVIFHPDEERSKDGRPVHSTKSGSSHRKGFEALVNCLLMSRCTALIRTASFLSGWSSVFNPQLPITLLNEPYTHKCWFPDRELIKRSDNRYRP